MRSRSGEPARWNQLQEVQGWRSRDQHQERESRQWRKRGSGRVSVTSSRNRCPGCSVPACPHCGCSQTHIYIDDLERQAERVPPLEKEIARLLLLCSEGQAREGQIAEELVACKQTLADVIAHRRDEMIKVPSAAALPPVTRCCRGQQAKHSPRTCAGNSICNYTR